MFVNPKTDQPYTDIKKAFAGACRAAQLTNLHWPDLRHTFGTPQGEAGFSEAVIAELIGHTSIETMRRYTHGTEQAKRAAVEVARPHVGTARANYAPEAEQPAARLAVSA